MSLESSGERKPVSDQPIENGKLPDGEYSFSPEDLEISAQPDAEPTLSPPASLTQPTEVSVTDSNYPYPISLEATEFFPIEREGFFENLRKRLRRRRRVENVELIQIDGDVLGLSAFAGSEKTINFLLRPALTVFEEEDNKHLVRFTHFPNPNWFQYNLGDLIKHHHPKGEGRAIILDIHHESVSRHQSTSVNTSKGQTEYTLHRGARDKAQNVLCTIKYQDPVSLEYTRRWVSELLESQGYRFRINPDISKEAVIQKIMQRAHDLGPTFLAIKPQWCGNDEMSLIFTQEFVRLYGNVRELVEGALAMANLTPANISMVNLRKVKGGSLIQVDISGKEVDISGRNDIITSLMTGFNIDFSKEKKRKVK